MQSIRANIKRTSDASTSLCCTVTRELWITMYKGTSQSEKGKPGVVQCDRSPAVLGGNEMTDEMRLAGVPQMYGERRKIGIAAAVHQQSCRTVAEGRGGLELGMP